MGLKNAPMLSMRQKLQDDAIAATGFDDFGNPEFVENMDRHLMSVDACGTLTPTGIRLCAKETGAFLRALLYGQAGLKARPEALTASITKPLIITGIPRSGTTALHRLLSVDPQFQGLEHWLCRTPMPRPPRQQWGQLPTYLEAKAAVEEVIDRAPEMLTEHMFSVDGVEESIYLLAATFCNQYFGAHWTSPSYDVWYYGADERPSFRWFADMLRLIGVDCPDQRWLMKNNSDLYSMDALLTAFPDAMIVQTHRDPVQAMPSMLNLVHALRRSQEEGNADATRHMTREIHFWKAALDRMEVTKGREPGRYLDIDFGDFTSDQIGTVRQIYSHFGMPLQENVEAEMLRWLADHPRRTGPSQRHKAETYGVSSSLIAELFTDYRRRYGYA